MLMPEELTPYLELTHLVYINRAIRCKAEKASKDVMYLSGQIPTGTLGVRVESYLPPVLPVFPGRLTSPFQSLLLRGCNLQSHTEWSPAGHTSGDLSAEAGSWGNH